MLKTKTKHILFVCRQLLQYFGYLQVPLKQTNQQENKLTNQPNWPKQTNWTDQQLYV